MKHISRMNIIGKAILRMNDEYLEMLHKDHSLGKILSGL